MTEFTFTVTHVASATDVTADVETVQWTETGTGEINSAVIRLESLDGKFLTTGAFNVDEYDKFRIQVTDDQSPQGSFDKLYEVSNIIPIENSQEGNILELELLGLEHHLQKAMFAKQFYFENAFNVIKDIGDQYNEDLGTLNPTLEDHDSTTFNQAPEWTANLYDFNVSERSVYDGMVEVVDALGNTVQSGGAADFFELAFEKGTTDTRVAARVFVSGSLPTAGNEVTINDTDDVNGDPSEGGLGVTEGTVVAAWGESQSGTLPPDTAKFHGKLEAFGLDPEWKSGVVGGYPQDARVQLVDVHYTSDINGNTDTPPTNWTISAEFQFLGTAKYSPWTEDRAGLWENAGSNPTGAATGFNEEGMWDGNMIVWDNNHYRTQVVKRVTTNAVGVGAGEINAEYLYGLTDYYRGLRFLVDPSLGALGGFWTQNGGNDRFGKPYSNNVVQHNGGTADDFNDFDVIRETKDGEEIGVTHEGSVFERQSGTWTDIHTTPRANDCFHGYTSITNNAGVNETFSNFAETTTYGDTSAIDIQYDYTTILPDPITGLWTTADANYYHMGWWLNFRIPFPYNTFNGISEDLGFFYGNNATKKEPVTLDMNNMHLTHSGNVGFNNTEAEDLGIINGIHFTIKQKWTDGTGGRILAGDFKCRVLLFDTEDNVVSADFTIAFNDIWQDVSIPISSFQIYRARIPYRYELDNIAAAFVLNALDIVNTFNWKNVKAVCMQWQEAYDEQGRYRPELGRINLLPFATGSGRVIVQLDRFGFTKPALAVTPPVTTGRRLIPKFRQMPLITNQIQLEQDALSALEVTKFRHKQYEIRTEGRFDINFGDTFFLQKDDLVSDDDTRTADSGGATSNIRLVAKKITYKISKTPSESGHFIRFITGIKRIIS